MNKECNMIAITLYDFDNEKYIKYDDVKDYLEIQEHTDFIENL